MDSKKLAYNLLIVALILVALYFGKALLIPFILALLVWYLLNSLRRLVARIQVGKKKKPLPWQLQLLVSSLVFLSGLWWFGKMIASNFEQFVEVYPKYHANIIRLSEEITTNFNLPLSIDEMVHDLDLPTLMTDLLNSSVNLVSTIFLVMVYVIFIITEERIFPNKLKNMFSSDDRYQGFLMTIKKIDESITTYLSAKTGLSLLTAIICYIILISIGVDFAILWAFLIFLTNYIPIIGAFFGILFPTLIAFIQFDGYVDAIIVVSCLSAVMIILGNFLEPKVLGDKLNLSPLSVIIALSFWGALWGIAGMFLCVPITVILMIIFAQFPTTRPVAVLLSGGKVV